MQCLLTTTKSNIHFKHLLSAWHKYKSAIIIMPQILPPTMQFLKTLYSISQHQLKKNCTIVVANFKKMSSYSIFCLCIIIVTITEILYNYTLSIYRDIGFSICLQKRSSSTRIQHKGFGWCTQVHLLGDGRSFPLHSAGETSASCRGLGCWKNEAQVLLCAADRDRRG